MDKKGRALAEIQAEFDMMPPAEFRSMIPQITELLGASAVKGILKIARQKRALEDAVNLLNKLPPGARREKVQERLDMLLLTVFVESQFADDPYAKRWMVSWMREMASSTLLRELAEFSTTHTVGQTIAVLLDTMEPTAPEMVAHVRSKKNPRS